MSLNRSILSFVIFLAVGCGSPNLLSEVVNVDPSGWYSPSELSFEVRDTMSTFDMMLTLRYDNAISADSIELLVSTTTPDLVRWSEPFTLYPVKGNRPIYTVEALYRTNIRWRQMGSYQISLAPQRTYRGVTAVGLEIKQQD